MKIHFLNVKTLVVVFVLAAVAVWFGLMQMKRAQLVWHEVDTEVHGLYPTQDCGFDFRQVFRTPDGVTCVRVANGDKVVKEAQRNMEKDLKENWESSGDEILNNFQKYVAEVLEGIARSWSGYR